MVTTIVSILTDFATAAGSFLSGHITEILIFISAIIILRILADFFRNTPDTDWEAIKLSRKATSLQQIMSMSWESYSFICKEVLRKQSYKLTGASVNCLGGIDLLAEKAKKRTLFRFGRSKLEVIDVKDIQKLVLRMQQTRSEDCCIISIGKITRSAEDSCNGIPVKIVESDELAEWFNTNLGTDLPVHRSRSDKPDSNYGKNEQYMGLSEDNYNDPMAA